MSRAVTYTCALALYNFQITLHKLQEMHEARVSGREYTETNGHQLTVQASEQNGTAVTTAPEAMEQLRNMFKWVCRLIPNPHWKFHTSVENRDFQVFPF